MLMKTKRMRRLSISVILVISAGLLSLALSKSDYYKNIAKSQKRINTIYKYLMSNYVDELNLEEFTKETIDHMLENVDPYTVYMVEEEKSDIDLLTKNAYFGIGVQIGKRDGKLTVISPIDDSPASKAGMMSGDVIVTIDGKNAGDISILDASKLIKGPKGTIVKLKVSREGSADLMDFDLERDEIVVKFVSYYGMIDDGTGYIRLTRFGKNAHDEIVTALDDLLSRNIHNLVLDLRDNTGGLLQSALEVLDLFVPKGEMLLTTKGRTSNANKEFRSKSDPMVPKDVKIAVLINQGSASASEIVAGTIQDLDRGILVGRTSFGKGLVQSIFPLDKQSTLKITTAKYYIPSGRLIQKPGYIDSAMVVSGEKEKNEYFTLSGRPVSGGGGVIPDSILEIEQSGALTQAIWRKGAFFTYVQKTKSNYATIEDVENDTLLLENFKSFLDTLDLNIILPGRSAFNESSKELISVDSTDEELSRALSSVEEYFQRRERSLFEREKAELEWRLMAEYIRIIEGFEEGMAYSLYFDKSVKTAISLLNDPEKYNHEITFHR